MEKRVKSILDELDNFVPDQHKYKVIEMRASNVIVAAMNVVKLIETSFSPEEAEDLTKKMLLAIKSGEPKKFANKIKMLGEKADEEKRIKKKRKLID